MLSPVELGVGAAGVSRREPVPWTVNFTNSWDGERRPEVCICPSSGLIRLWYDLDQLALVKPFLWRAGHLKNRMLWLLSPCPCQKQEVSSQCSLGECGAPGGETHKSLALLQCLTLVGSPEPPKFVSDSWSFPVLVLVPMEVAAAVRVMLGSQLSVSLISTSVPWNHEDDLLVFRSFRVWLTDNGRAAARLLVRQPIYQTSQLFIFFSLCFSFIGKTG